MTNEKLIETLTRETDSFRVEYLTQTRHWATKDFARLEKLAAERYTYEQFATPGFVKGPNNWVDYAQGKKYRKATDRRDAAIKITRAGLQAYVAKMVTLAERHYADSIIKLAARIESKGLDLTTLEVLAGHVGVNLEITFTDAAGKRVRAFTIIASGMVQRPHYRYLIK